MKNFTYIEQRLVRRTGNMDLLSRITMDPKVMGGRPTIRKMRFTVVQLLELLAGGMAMDEILEDYPYLEQDDIYACLQYAVKATNTRQVVSFVGSF